MRGAALAGRPDTASGRLQALAEALAVSAIRLAAGRTGARVAIWNIMRRTLGANFSMREAIEVAISATPRNAARRFMLRRWQYAYADGNLAFVAEIARWVPASEGMIFAALRQGNARELFGAAARVARVRQLQLRAVRGAVLQPCAILAVTLAMVWWAGGELLPRFRAFSDAERWTGLARAGYGFGTALHDYDLLFGALLAAGLAGIWIAVLRWTGPGRRKLDDFVPFSLYRVVNGTAFLLMVLELMKLGVDLNERTWRRLSAGASPYVRSRMEAIQAEMVFGGMGFGRALAAAGTGFPDYELAATAAALDGREGWHEEMGEFLVRWVEESEESMQTAAAAMSVFLLVCCVVLSMFVLLPVFQSFIHLREVGS